MAEVGKKARGEAVIAAWSRVVLVIVGGTKVKHLALSCSPKCDAENPLEFR